MTADVRGVCLTLAYDGTEFTGWQRQPGQRTVQSTLEEAIESMAGHPVRARGASRTDAGVHATGQLVGFDTERDVSPLGWLRGLNGVLPLDVAVRAVEICEAGYNPRRDAAGKHYRYLLQTGEARDPLLRHRAWHLGPREVPRREGTHRDDDARQWLDFAAVEQAIELMCGTHDFRAFRASDDTREHTVRTLSAIDLITPYEGSAGLLAVDVHGDAFLKNMVRIMVGTLVEVGRGRFGLDHVAALFGDTADRRNAGPTAPPQGLTLISVLRRSRGAVDRAAEDR